MDNATSHRVRIVDKNHPHFGESGFFKGEIIEFKHWNGRMAKIELNNCAHGNDACFVSPGQIVRVDAPYLG